MEYSDIHTCRINNTCIIIHKYPIIKQKCETYVITPIAYRHGKLQLDNKVSKCKNEIKRINKC